uniref:guanine nucleotide-binding protein subunit beta-like n=1 Tax=Erigeron canadensis TaxID=72917 RepID=UPI001CB89905|nr:guanine nucleotide-binding protein subunit beta-like [Erigeron canadensis]
MFSVGSCDAIARLWDTHVASRAVRTFHGHEEDVNSVKFFPDGNRFGTGSDDGTCKLYDIRTGQQLQVYLQQQQQGGANVPPVQGCANDRQVMDGKEFGIKERRTVASVEVQNTMQGRVVENE